jgi:hypothetical protein
MKENKIDRLVSPFFGQVEWMAHPLVVPLLVKFTSKPLLIYSFEAVG